MLRNRGNYRNRVMAPCTTAATGGSYVPLGGESVPEMPVKIACAPMPHVFRRYPVRVDHRRLQLLPP